MARILVMEDDEAVGTAIRMALEEVRDYDVIWAENCLLAEQAVKEAPPDLAILDAVVPAGGTAKPCILFAAALLAKAIPILLMTGHPDLADIFDELDFPLLRKPFRPRRLRQEVALTLAEAARNLRRMAQALENLRRQREQFAERLALLGDFAAELEALLARG